MPVGPRTAAKRLSKSLAKLSEILFDEDCDEHNKKEQKDAWTSSRIGSLTKGDYWRIGKDSFTLSIEDLDWMGIMRESGMQSEELEKYLYFELFWLVANNTVPGWYAEMETHYSISWYRD
jgi:hypothetical protein